MVTVNYSLDAETLRGLLRYEPETGKLFWKERGSDAFNAQFAGKEALISRVDGYNCGEIFSNSYKAHRVIWCMETGEWPSDQIDHINGVRDDNRFDNLRPATHQENMRNMKRPDNNTSGTIGVSWHKVKRKWMAGIVVSKKRVHLGYFDDKFDAILSRLTAEKVNGFHKNHGRAVVMEY